MLREHLKLISDIYKEYEIETQEIMPISKIDVEIIDLIIEATLKHGHFEFSDILKEWKEEEDQEIYDKLLVYTDSIKKQVFFPRSFITIGKQVNIDVKLVNSISKVDGYDYVSNNPLYGIVVNEDPQERMFCHNKTVNFLSEEERDCELDRVKEVLRESNVHFF